MASNGDQQRSPAQRGHHNGGYVSPNNNQRFNASYHYSLQTLCSHGLGCGGGLRCGGCSRWCRSSAHWDALHGCRCHLLVAGHTGKIARLKACNQGGGERGWPRCVGAPHLVAGACWVQGVGGSRQAGIGSFGGGHAAMQRDRHPQGETQRPETASLWCAFVGRGEVVVVLNQRQVRTSVEWLQEADQTGKRPGRNPQGEEDTHKTPAKVEVGALKAASLDEAGRCAVMMLALGSVPCFQCGSSQAGLLQQQAAVEVA